MIFFSAEPTDKVADQIIDDFNDIDDLKNVLRDIVSLVDSTVYKKLVLGTPDNSLINSGDYDEPSTIAKLAGKNMSKFPLRIPGGPLIGSKEVLVIYTFINDLYSFRIGRELSSNELNALFYGDLATRILLMLDDFDSTKKTPTTDDKFFKKLGKQKWQDKKTKKLFNEFYKLYFMLIFNNKLDKERESGSSFDVTQDAFLRLLSGCYAVNNGRDRISPEDIVQANKLYLKLIHTDLTRFMK